MLTIHDYEPPSPKTWHLVVQGTRNSWDSHAKSDSTFMQGRSGDVFTFFALGEADKSLLVKLVKAGPDHGKMLRQLPIVIDMTGPESWWKQIDTYRVGTTRNSTSTMHTLGKHEMTADMFSWEDVGPVEQAAILDNLNFLREAWLAAGKRKGPEQKEWRALVNALPMGFNFRSCWSGNYQVLRSMYHARKHHRLGEWRQWCEWITTLPYSELITVE
jgi:hypothetical protein